MSAFLLFLLTAFSVQAGESFTGQWSGSYANSTGERGPDSLFLAETPDGRLSGTWSGSIPMVGRRINANTAQLRGKTATRSYQFTAVVRGNAMSMKYVATRLDKPGAYEGVSNFSRR